MFRLRLIPATIVIAALYLAVKIVDVTRGTEALSDQLFISTVIAQQPNESANKPEPPAPPKEGEAASENAEAPPANAPPAEGASKAPVKTMADKLDDAMLANACRQLEKTRKKTLDSAGETVDQRYTKVELELLKNLVKRREELDRWERNIGIKESTLDATEKRINDKITQIESMKKEVSGLLDQYNEKEDTKIKSLVKIYESMKPKEAARIFDEVEMPILLLVIDKMSEKKAAPILAEMDSKKAKQITVQLAEQRRVNTGKVNPALFQKAQ